MTAENKITKLRGLQGEYVHISSQKSVHNFKRC